MQLPLDEEWEDEGEQEARILNLLQEDASSLHTLAGEELRAYVESVRGYAAARRREQGNHEPWI